MSKKQLWKISEKSNLGQIRRFHLILRRKWPFCQIATTGVSGFWEKVSICTCFQMCVRELLRQAESKKKGEKQAHCSRNIHQRCIKILSALK